MFGFVRGVRGRAAAVVLVMAALSAGVTAGSVVAGPSTTVTWKVSFLTAGQVKSLSDVASSNSPGVERWLKTGSCTLSPTSRPTTLTMGRGPSCTLKLKIAESGKYPAKTSTKIITQKSATTTTVAPTTTTVALTCAMGGSCAVGDLGPSGGFVFYDAGSTQSWGRYLEAGNSDTVVYRTWATGANQSAEVTGAEGDAIGTGAANTLDIVAQSGNEAATSAAVYSDSLSYGGFTDWFLPSIDELRQMSLYCFGSRDCVHGLDFWSSSEGPYGTNAQRQFIGEFGNARERFPADINLKSATHYVHPVRAFTPSGAPPPTTVAPTTTTEGPTTTGAPALYNVGDPGPGGGTIFYVDMARAVGSQYFEAACVGWSDGTCGGSDLTDPTARWGCWGTSITGADGTAIGDGEQNTTDIRTGCATFGIAARLAKNLVLGGQSDWFLPSKNELNRMYIRRIAIGGFSSNYYWSSSDNLDTRAWSQRFRDGFQVYDSKDSTSYVRPVRTVSGPDEPPTTEGPATTTEAPALYNVGDPGPGGGTIFYVDMARAVGSQYFEAACVGWSDGTCGGSDLTDPEAQWGCFGTSITGADGTAIGDGEQNTTDIRTGCATFGIAARLAKNLVLGGQSDWFLPSKNELSRMYIRRIAIGGFSSNYYWSSSEFGGNSAWLVLFNGGSQYNFHKYFTSSVRPVRAF